MLLQVVNASWTLDNVYELDTVAKIHGMLDRGKTGNLGVVHKLLDDFQGPPEPDPSLCNTAIILASPLPP